MGDGLVFFSWLIWSPTNIDLNLHFHNNDPLRKVVGDMIEPSLNSVSIQIGQKGEKNSLNAIELQQKKNIYFYFKRQKLTIYASILNAYRQF